MYDMVVLFRLTFLGAQRGHGCGGGCGGVGQLLLDRGASPVAAAPLAVDVTSVVVVVIVGRLIVLLQSIVLVLCLI